MPAGIWTFERPDESRAGRTRKDRRTPPGPLLVIVLLIQDLQKAGIDVWTVRTVDRDDLAVLANQPRDMT